MNSWNSAAAAELTDMYSFSSDGRGVHDLRHQLDAMIDDYLRSDPSTDQEECRSRWIELGRIGRNLGIDLGYLYFFSTPGQLLEVLVRKQQDYGHENIARFGRLGLLVRVHDKIARLENLLGSGAKPNNESILDNIGDVIGYAAIGGMWERGSFLLALEQPTVVESVVTSPMPRTSSTAV